jgi:hypothetical protein
MKCRSGFLSDLVDNLPMSCHPGTVLSEDAKLQVVSYAFNDICGL